MSSSNQLPFFYSYLIPLSPHLLELRKKRQYSTKKRWNFFLIDEVQPGLIRRTTNSLKGRRNQGGGGAVFGRSVKLVICLLQSKWKIHRVLNDVHEWMDTVASRALNSRGSQLKSGLFLQRSQYIDLNFDVIKFFQMRLLTQLWLLIQSV